jgi:hypothetical protein
VFLSDGSDTLQYDTGPDGYYFFYVPDGTYSVAVQIPQDSTPSPADQGTDDTVDSDGEPDGFGFSTVPTVTVVGGNNPDTDFGFTASPVEQPGTGTPGYWKNHPNAWPEPTITVGGIVYTKDQAITWLRKVSKDKTTTMFSSLVPAMLNVRIGNDASCVSSTIDAANEWMATYGPVGSGVAASSTAWRIGESLHSHLDSYNNGLLCAPHRD